MSQWEAAPFVIDENTRRFLDFLGKAEGADYNTIVGGKSFEDFGAHPNIVGLRTKEGPSTAAGRYQIVKTTYDDIAPKLNIRDFSPESQDRIAVELIKRRGALEDIQKGDFNAAISKLGTTWASLPSSPYSQPKRSPEWVQQTLDTLITPANAGEGNAPMASKAQDDGWESAPVKVEAPAAANDDDGWESAPTAPQPAGFGNFLLNEVKGLGRKADDFVRGAADTLTFGYADEIAAAGDTAIDALLGRTKQRGINDLITGEDNTVSGRYDQNLAAQRARDAEGGAARFTGQLGGGVLPIVKGAQLAKRGLDAAKSVFSLVPTGRAAVGAVTGGTTAGLYGTGSAEGDLAERMASGAQAVPFGMAVGAVAPWAVEKTVKGGTAVVNKVKDVAGIKVPIERLSPAAQRIVQNADPNATSVTPKAAKALEKLSTDPKSVASDLRVRDLFTSEKARVLGADPQRAIPDDEIFKNVGDKLKDKANQTIETLRKAGEIDADTAKELKTIISRAARHNRAITGAIKNEELAAELSRGFRTDDSIIDGLKLSRKTKDILKEAVKDLDTVTYNSLKKNQGGIFQNIGGVVGSSVGQVGGTPGTVLGRQVGAGTGRIVDKVLLQQGTAPVLKRNVDRLAAGLDEAGVKAGDTVKNLDDVAESALKKLSRKAVAEQSAKEAVSQRLSQQNIALARARAPYAEGSKLGPNASPQAVLVEAFEDATGIKHKPGMVQDVLKSLRKDENLGPAFQKEVDQALKALGNKPGRIDNLTNLVRAVRAKAAEQKALGTLKVRAGQTAEQGAGRIRNAERYNAKVIENTLRDIMGETPPNPNQGALSAATKGAAAPLLDLSNVPAAQRYVGNPSFARNLRGDRAQGWQIAEDIDDIVDLTKALNGAATKEPTTVYRGLNNADFIKGLKPGDTFRDPSFVSTATSPSSAFIQETEKYGGAVFKINLPKGTKAALTKPSGDFYADEAEMLLQRGSEFRIKSIKERGDVTEYVLDLVKHNPTDDDIIKAGTKWTDSTLERVKKKLKESK
jgi:muramidase (phage lysozyme)